MRFKNNGLSKQVEAPASGRKPHPWAGVGATRRIIAETTTAIGCIRTLAVYGYSYRYRLALLALLTPARSISPLLTPLIMQLLIDKAYPTRDMRLFAWLCALLLGLRILPNVLSCLSGYLSTYVQVLMQYKHSLRVFNAIHRLPQSYREAHDSGVFLERATRDVSAVAASITRLVPEIVTILFTFLAALRTVLKNAPILLLDEVTSSMDIESEKQLLKGIVALRPPGCATLLVTHHIAVTTEPWIDNIVVMVNGRVSERGSCAQLQEERGFYHHWLTLSKGASLDHVAITDDL